ncbi:MAG TPA: acyl-CoA reductase [Candidatus Angelobacter sp.]|nr:acyl-CoA reductase [Candidatus Angelobacter sp.]
MNGANPPGYFLADLPSEAALNATTISEACAALKRNRDRYLAGRPTDGLIAVLAGLAESWLDAENPFRRRALESGTNATGFSAATLASGLDALFRQLTADNLSALLQQELGHVHRLDRFVATAGEHKTQRTALATGPRLLVHVTSGNLPAPALMSIVSGLLVRSAQFVKCASGAALLPRLFAHSLYETEPKLGACIEIAEWKGGRLDLETALLAEADCVTATGSDETLAEIRRQVPPHVRFLGYGHRVSFGFVAQEVLTGRGAKTIAAAAAADVAAWDQLGCLSPHLFYIEPGGAVSPELFAEMLAVELAKRETNQPRGEITPVESAAIAARRALYEVRAAASEDTRQWQSQESTAWTVIHEADPRFQMSCLNRFVYIKPAANLSEALRAAELVRGKVSTVGLAATEPKAGQLATELARWGVTRICPVGQMQNPPLTWRHDGRPGLGDLVTWTDWEQ